MKEQELLKEINRYRLELLDKDEEIKEKEKTILELEALIKSIQAENQKLESSLADAAKVGEEPPAVNLQPEKSENLGEETPASELDPEPIPSQQLTLNLESEAVSPEPETVGSDGLLEYINKNFPESGVKYSDIRDAIRDKDKKAKDSEFSRLANYEKAYKFKFIGKIKSKNRFKILAKS